MKNSVLLSGSALVIVSTFSKLLGFAREQAFASALGAGQLSDAYVLAQFIPVLVFAIPATLFTNAFLPIYSAYRARGENERAALFARTTARMAFVVCVGMAAAGAMASPFLVRLAGPGLSQETATLAARLTAVLFPANAAATFVALSTAALNSHGAFVLPGLYAVFPNVFGIAGLMLFTKQYSVWGITYGWLLGAVVGLLMQLPGLLRSTPVLSVGHIDLKDESVLAMLHMSGPLVLASILGQIYGLVDKSLASGLQHGSLAALNYAIKVVQLPVTVVVTAVCTVMFPRLAECWGRKDTQGLTHLVARSVTVISALAVPAAVAFGTLSVPIVRVVYQRGAFSETAVALTASAVVFFAMGVVLQSFSLFLQRTAFSMQDSRTPLLSGVMGNLVAIPLAYTLVPTMAHNGLALANTLGFSATVTIMAVAILRRLPTLSASKMLRDLLSITASAVGMATVTRVLLVQLPVRGGDLASAFRFFVAAGVGAGVYAAGLVMSGVVPLSLLRGVARRCLSVVGVRG